jgi:hypothetical protein
MKSLFHQKSTATVFLIALAIGVATPPSIALGGKCTGDCG